MWDGTLLSDFSFHWTLKDGQLLGSVKPHMCSTFSHSKVVALPSLCVSIVIVLIILPSALNTLLFIILHFCHKRGIFCPISLKFKDLMWLENRWVTFIKLSYSLFDNEAVSWDFIYLFLIHGKFFRRVEIFGE